MPVESFPAVMPRVEGSLVGQAVTAAAVTGLAVVSITSTRLSPVSSTYRLPFR